MKRLQKLGIVFALLLAVSLAAAFVCIRVKTVTVQGNRIYSEEAARKALLPKAEGERSAELLFRLWRGKKKQLAFLTGYDIRFTSPFSGGTHTARKAGARLCALYECGLLF